MARDNEIQPENPEMEKKRLKEEKKKLKQENRLQQKEAKKRAKEIAAQEAALEDDEEGGGLFTFLATIFIIVLWIGIFCAIVKLDVGGIGTNIMTPLLKDIPVINKILPGDHITETEDKESYGGYSSLKDAVEQMKKLELELERAQSGSLSKDEEIEALKAEVLRLKEFEEKQVEFQRIRTEFYEEVIYAENGPGAEEYRKYYEEMDPATAEYLYKQVVIQMEESKEIQEYAAAYSEMKPKQAASIFESMTENLDLVAKILNAMDTKSRGNILGVMDPKIAAKITKIMDPES